jgi:hypothetical protein
VNRPQPLHHDANHYRTLYTCLSLFVVLYLPEAGFDDAPVGEELMEWLNTHFIEPSSEEGDHLSSQDRPWEDELFWPYLTRYVIAMPETEGCLNFLSMQVCPAGIFKGIRFPARNPISPSF